VKLGTWSVVTGLGGRATIRDQGPGGWEARKLGSVAGKELSPAEQDSGRIMYSARSCWFDIRTSTPHIYRTVQYRRVAQHRNRRTVASGCSSLCDT